MLPDLQTLMKEAEAMQGRMEAARTRLGGMILQGSAAEGEITVTINGLLEVQKVSISVAAADKFNLKDIEDHLQVAMNMALQMAQAQASSEMEKASGGLNPAKLLKNLQGFGS